MTVDVLGGGGEREGFATEIEGWGEEGTYSFSRGRLVVDFTPGETWMASRKNPAAATARAICSVTLAQSDVLQLRSCTGMDADKTNLEDSDFTRSPPAS